MAPTPDLDDTPSADFANQPAGTYDDEMLNAHFSCGDGRCNENIALSTIHQVFHSEHDRLVDYFKNVLTNDTSGTGVTALAQWKLPVAQSPDGWNGERLFQAARFVTEMEYQHLVFEEFARKVQPEVKPFFTYDPAVNPAVEAEFAHAVYRFGHSMLDDDVARTTTVPVTPSNPSGTTDNSVPLLTAFLNPPEFFNDGNGGFYTPEQAAGAIVMGSSDQTGNELDEFVVETLRNNLLGLPLDLPTINMTRAREAGIPPLNEVRRQIHAETNDAQLAPYTNWSDFGQHLKHPESLINFVAAYGTHPSITGETTLAGKRARAKLIVDPANPSDPDIPADAADFMFSNGPTWGNDSNGVTNTGLDKVDLWVGGLAEVTNLFGGLLGSTFNYVFQTQLEKLQDSDRLYYLARTPGINLRTQLEGNSFAELIQRNTDNTNTLKADAFSTADCKFQLSHLEGTPAGYALHGFLVADDVTTECDETLVLLRMPNGGIQYRQRNTVDPSGINGQSVYQGTPGVDIIAGGNDNDTFWGAEGNDIIEGNGGDDVALGGEGNDIITDFGGFDVLKGGPGNDAIDAGPSDDIIMGGEGQDFMNGGLGGNEIFAGPGDDFVMAGNGVEDGVFGDSGDDWMEGGIGADLLQGDHGAPFFDDPAQVKPGNDIFMGQQADNDYDTEGGDDLMEQNPSIDKNVGSSGFDWAFHQADPMPADDDLQINNFLDGLAIQNNVNRDRWQEVEAISGSPFDDLLKGHESAPRDVGGVTGAVGGASGCNILDQAGVDRIDGLNAIVPQPLTEDAAPVIEASAAGFCPVTGPVFGAGDILIGGAGSDAMTGRGADDIIDGDRYLRVRISLVDPGTGVEIASTDLMEHAAITGSFPNSLPNTTLQAAVFAGNVDPGDLRIVREILTPGPNTDTDTAVFRNPINTYTITFNPNGSITVDNQGGTDGIDTLWNIEQLQFSDTTVPAVDNPANTAATGTVTISDTTPTAGEALAVSAALADVDGGVNLSSVRFTWQRETATDVWETVTGASVGDTFIPGNLEVGLRLRVVASFRDMAGNPETIISAPTSPVAAPLVPLAVAGPATVAGPAAPLGPLTVTVTVGSSRIALQGTNQARVVSVVSSASGKVQARFIFAPKGIKFHGTKTIVRGRDASGHIVLKVMVRGDAKHGYQLRATNGGKQSKWLKLKNKRVVLVATLSPGLKPSLAKAN